MVGVSKCFNHQQHHTQPRRSPPPAYEPQPPPYDQSIEANDEVSMEIVHDDDNNNIAEYEYEKEIQIPTWNAAACSSYAFKW